MTLVLLTAVPALAGHLTAPVLAEDTTPGGSAAAGFPIALLVLAVVAVVTALVWRAVASRKRQRDGSGG